MKPIKIAGLCLIVTIAAVGGWAWGDIEGSKHDFSDRSWSKDDLCGVCHPPHREEAPQVVPLWDPQADLSERFGKFRTGAEGPGPGTRVCLQCHDGTIASETVAGTIREPYGNTEHPGIFDIGHDPTDHPVGVQYPQMDEGYLPVTSVAAKGTVPLPDGKVECISCHDPHDFAGVEHMLVMSNARSALCLTCHKK